MNTSEVQKNIETTYSSISKMFKQNVHSHLFDKKEIDIFFKSLHPNSIVLDAGCGTGIVSSEIKNKYGHEVVGVDISEGMIALAKKHYQDIEFIKMNVLELDFPDNSFDAIFAYFVLIHITKSDIPKALVEFKRVLKPEGKILFSFQMNNENPKEDYYPLVYDESKKLFLNVISQDEIQRELTKAGFIADIIVIRDSEKSEFDFKKLLVCVKTN